MGKALGKSGWATVNGNANRWPTGSMNVEQAVVLHYIGRDHQRAHHLATLGERQDQPLIGRDRAENSPLYIRQLGLERVRRRLAGYGVELAG